MMSICKQMQPSVQIPPNGLKLDIFNPKRQKDKVVIIMGATGTGKSKLSIDLANHFPIEVINSDKMQVYEGLDTVINKITKEEQNGVPHHLLGVLKNPNVDFTATNFCDMASLSIESILGHNRLPVIVGGSNTFIEHLVDDYDYKFRSKYHCCFLWVDVYMPVLYSFVSKRVDKMVQNGMVDEVRKFFEPNANYSKGIRRAIGVPEFDKYFKEEAILDKRDRAKLLQDAINEVKENTCKLACRQLGKIHRLRRVKGWTLHRLDATEVFRNEGQEAEDAWEKCVAEPSAMIVGQFLYNAMSDFPSNISTLPTGIGTSMAAASY